MAFLIMQNHYTGLFLDIPLMKDDICVSTFALLLPTDEAAKGGGALDTSTLSEPATKWPHTCPEDLLQQNEL